MPLKISRIAIIILQPHNVVFLSISKYFNQLYFYDDRFLRGGGEKEKSSGITKKKI